MTRLIRPRRPFYVVTTTVEDISPISLGLQHCSKLRVPGSRKTADMELGYSFETP